MPINNFNGETFVAFTDISGFKELMKNDENALKAIKIFYQSGYNALTEFTNVEGIFISDCGVIFSKSGSNEKKLNDLLKVIDVINREMLDNNLMLTTSIAYGNFNYQGKIEFIGIEKNPLYGIAYLNAFLDNEKGSPRIQPGQTRICLNNLPDLNLNEIIEYSTFKKLRKVSKKHYYYYWNLNEIDEFDEFESDYKNSYSLKYSGMLNALKGRNL